MALGFGQAIGHVRPSYMWPWTGQLKLLQGQLRKEGGGGRWSRVGVPSP